MVTAKSSGEVRFRFFAPSAHRVEVLGDFTGWEAKPLPLEREDGGWWSGLTVVNPGDYDFHYRIDGAETIADYAAYGVKMNRFGRWVSRIAIPKQAA